MAVSSSPVLADAHLQLLKTDHFLIQANNLISSMASHIDKLHLELSRLCRICNDQHRELANQQAQLESTRRLHAAHVQDLLDMATEERAESTDRINELEAFAGAADELIYSLERVYQRHLCLDCGERPLGRGCDGHSEDPEWESEEIQA